MLAPVYCNRGPCARSGARRRPRPFVRASGSPRLGPPQKHCVGRRCTDFSDNRSILGVSFQLGGSCRDFSSLPNTAPFSVPPNQSHVRPTHPREKRIVAHYMELRVNRALPGRRCLGRSGGREKRDLLRDLCSRLSPPGISRLFADPPLPLSPYLAGLAKEAKEARAARAARRPPPRRRRSRGRAAPGSSSRWAVSTVSSRAASRSASGSVRSSSPPPRNFPRQNTSARLRDVPVHGPRGGGVPRACPQSATRAAS